tara:strand:+ start:250 stop:909 length:660 start_codon:yes stop_codon:yes gene_type:complete
VQLLATKILAPDFKDRLIQQDFSIVEFPFVTIIPLPFPEVFLEKHIILTSQNATQFLLAQDNISELCSRSFFYCVGEGSAQLLRGHHATVVEVYPSASELADRITKQHSNKPFSYCCGKRRLPILENRLEEAKVSLRIHEVYQSKLNSKPMGLKPDGILFYSPSAVDSYVQENEIQESHCFCIGPTTAQKVHPHSLNYSVAKQPNNNSIYVEIMQHYYA